MNIELNSPEELKAAQQAVAATNLASCGLAQRLLKCTDDGSGTLGNFLGRIMQLEREMLAYMETDNRLRIAELEQELTAVVAEGQ